MVRRNPTTKIATWQLSRELTFASTFRLLAAFFVPFSSHKIDLPPFQILQTNMLSNKTKTSALIVFLALLGSVEGRGHGRHSALLAPRRYQYSRSLDPIDMIGEIFTAPIYMNSMLGRNEPNLLKMSTTNSPSYDVSVDTENGLVELTVELPGVRSEDLDIELVDASLLRIRASRKVKHNGSFVQQEFDQSFQLDRDVDPDHIKASLTNGVLTVQAKRKEKSVKKISILLDEASVHNAVAESNEIAEETLSEQDPDDVTVVDSD